MKETLFWVMFGFFFGVVFIASLQGNYERPSKWEDGGIIKHGGKSYKLQQIEIQDEKK